MSLAMYDELLKDLADRCYVHDEKTLRKSRELIGLLNSKRSINCSDTCKLLICLELASSLTSASFSRDTAIKLSGCAKRIYVNNYNNISKLLNLDKIYTTKEVCLLTGVSQVSDSSETLLKKYQAHNCLDISLLEHPMYPCASVLAVCNVEKLPINLSRLVELSRIKKTDLKKLSLNFSKLYEKKSVDVSNKEIDTDNITNSKLQKRDEYFREREEEISDEKYYEWKRRMLEDD